MAKGDALGSAALAVMTCGLGSTADDSVRLGVRGLGSTADDAALLGTRHAVWGPRIGTTMDETAASALPSRGPLSGRWVQDAVEQGAELAIDAVSFDTDDMELDAQALVDPAPSFLGL